jgi:hypothetical protein
MQKGLAITGIMDEVESAAMWRDARVLDNQARTILRHLRYKFESKIRGIYKLKEGSELIDLFDDDDDEILFVIPSTETTSTPMRPAPSAGSSLHSASSSLHSANETETQAVITPTNPPVERLLSTRTSVQEELIMEDEDGMMEEC